jgi:hypothetical protein
VCGLLVASKDEALTAKKKKTKKNLEKTLRGWMMDDVGAIGVVVSVYHVRPSVWWGGWWWSTYGWMDDCR